MLEHFKFCKTREVVSPCRGTEEAAGIDFFVPTNLDEKIMNEKMKMTKSYPLIQYNLFGHLDKISLKPRQSVLIPSGIHISLDKGYCLEFKNKSGVAAKKHLLVGSCVAASTIIETNKGKFTAETLTKEFIQKNNILILSYDIQNDKFIFCNFDGFRVSNIKECIRLIFDNGEVLECSDDHLIYTKNRGYILAKELTDKDIIKIM